MANNPTIHTLLQAFDILSTEQLDTLKCKFQSFLFEKEFELIFAPLTNPAIQETITCPICSSTHIVKRGQDCFGEQRYLCKNEACKRTSFSLKTNTLLYYSKSKKQQWRLFFECLLNGDTIATSDSKVGICENTVIAWRRKTRYLINQMLEHQKLEGLVELDETFFDGNQKGMAGKVETKNKPKKEEYQKIK